MSILLAGLAAIHVAPAALAGEGAAQCRMSEAVYGLREGGYTLRFFDRATWPAPAGASGLFVLAIDGFQPEPEGSMTRDVETGASLASIGLGCDASEAASETAADCALWSGFVYALDPETGALSLSGQEEEAAPAMILLSGFQSALHRSDIVIDYDLQAPLGDVFVLAGCDGTAPACRWRRADFAASGRQYSCEG